MWYSRRWTCLLVYYVTTCLYQGRMVVAVENEATRQPFIAYDYPEGESKKHGEAYVTPWLQNIPIGAENLEVRPPKPIIPEKHDIFVGLSAFRDGIRCGYTIFTGFKRAKNPDRLYFGVVDQVNAEDLKCVDEYCKLAMSEWPGEECKYRKQIKIHEMKAGDSRGPTLARHYQQTLVQSQDFCLQLDAHSVFTNNWDLYLVKEWSRTENEMAILSTYLHHIHTYVSEDGTNNPPDQLPHLCTTTRGGNGCVRNIAASMIIHPSMPQMQALWGAGLSFGKCHAEKRVRIDPHTLWMFDGEEFLRASHLWTYGYDMYSPSITGCVVYHNYTAVPARFEHVTVDDKLKQEEEEMGINRFHLLVNKPFKGRVNTFDFDQYAYGNVRTLQQYLAFSGISFDADKQDVHSCKQLHWVPYTNSTEIEQLVPGYIMQPPSTIVKTNTKKTQENPDLSLEEVKNPHLRVKDYEEDQHPGMKLNANANVNKELMAMPLYSVIVWMGMGCLCFALLILMNRNNTNMKRMFRMKHKATDR